MKLYLIRHAATADDSEADEANRGLSDKGRSRMVLAVLGLSKIKVEPELILSSPLKPALETAEIVARGLGNIAVETMQELSPGTQLDALVGALRPRSGLNSVALVGHQPELADLASFLLAGSPDACRVELRKGGVALLRGELADTPPRCTLDWLLPPRVLRRL